MKSSSVMLNFDDNDQIHIKRIGESSTKSPVICLQGAFSSGRVFYNKTNTKGLAPSLAQVGFETFIPDYRGHGKSEPKVSKETQYGMNDLIVSEFPFLFKKIKKLSGHESFHVVAHSDGGTFFVSFLARFPEWHERIKSITLLGSKRAIRVKSLKKFISIDLLWYWVMPVIVGGLGYLPSRMLGIGSDSDSKKFTLERLNWLKGGDWIDPVDQFDYMNAWKSFKRPPLKGYAAENDPFLGNKIDVWGLMNELGYSKEDFKVLGHKSGYQRDYDHTSMLTDPRASEDHFTEIIQWIEQNENLVNQYN